MIDISSLPRDPTLALQSIIATVVAAFSGNGTRVDVLKGHNHPEYLNLMIAVRVARQSANRIADEETKSLCLGYLKFDEKETLSQISGRFLRILDAIIANQLDDHFLDPNDVVQFDEARLDKSEKAEILSLLARARHLTNSSQAIPVAHKRRVCYRIAQVENELWKEVVGFRAFMAAAYEASSLLRRFGEDAQPIADAIEKARTITERKVSGYAQVEQAAKPKQLPKPEGDGE